jgi:hypothetical protein
MKINFTALSLFISIFSFSQGINTMERNDAGQSADIKSGFYQTVNPTNYPSGAQPGQWWHLIDVRHTNTANNYAMQLAGSFFDQKLFFRKTANNPAQPWSKILMENPSGNVGIGTESPTSKLEIADSAGATLSITTNKINGSNTASLKPALEFLGYANFKKARIEATEQTYYGHGSALSFFVNDGTSENSLKKMMAINQYGNVGIGTENPQAKLDVGGNVIFGDFISSGSNSWMFHSPDDGRTSLHIAPKGASGNFDWNKQLLLNQGNMALYGKFEAREVKVTTTPTADFVFAEDYNLPKLEEVEKHIKEKKHLPEIASAKEMQKEGVNIGEFQIKLLQKIEELTLYSIEQNKKINFLLEQNKEQTEKINQLENK